ncbi:hypothetical protein ACFWX2_35840, partial [Amycolatopsis sp. NPDC059020]
MTSPMAGSQVAPIGPAGIAVGTRASPGLLVCLGAPGAAAGALLVCRSVAAGAGAGASVAVGGARGPGAPGAGGAEGRRRAHARRARPP